MKLVKCRDCEAAATHECLYYSELHGPSEYEGGVDVCGPVYVCEACLKARKWRLQANPSPNAAVKILDGELGAAR